jgi:hypothetical protein
LQIIRRFSKLQMMSLHQYLLDLLHETCSYHLCNAGITHSRSTPVTVAQIAINIQQAYVHFQIVQTI